MGWGDIQDPRGARGGRGALFFKSRLLPYPGSFLHMPLNLIWRLSILCRCYLRRVPSCGRPFLALRGKKWLDNDRLEYAGQL